jgi:hypothetical protein
VLAPDDVVAVDFFEREGAGELFGDEVDDVVHLGRGAEESGEGGDGAVADTAGDDVVEHRQVGVDVEREPVAGAAARDLHSDRGHLRTAGPHTGEARFRLRVDSETRQRRDDDRLQPADVGQDISLPVAPARQREDRVADELPGAVVRDVAAAVGPHELGSDGSGRDEDVAEIGTRTERVHVGMLEQQQVVVGAALVEPALERVGVAIRDAPEPTCLQGGPTHVSSASQSRVSRISFIRRRNAAA